MSEFIETQTKTFQAHALQLNKRRHECTIFKKWSLEYIKEFIEEIKVTGYYEGVYVITNDEMLNIKTTNQSFIKFYDGSHPTGITETKINKDSKMTTFSVISENSGGLTIAQEPQGEVVFLVFPAQSDILKWRDVFIIYKYFSSPKKISWYNLKSATEFYLRFARYTSIYSKPSPLEKFELWRIKFKWKEILTPLFGGIKFTTRIIAIAHGIQVKPV